MVKVEGKYVVGLYGDVINIAVVDDIVAYTQTLESVQDLEYSVGAYTYANIGSGGCCEVSIVFCEEQLCKWRFSIVAHECIHALSTLLKTKGIFYDPDNDEPVAYLYADIFAGVMSVLEPHYSG